MDDNKKPVTSKDFNQKIKEENKEYANNKIEEPVKTSPVIILLVIIFITSFTAGCVITVINLVNKSNNNTVNETPEKPVEPDKIEELKEIDIKGYEDIMERIDFARNTKLDFNVSDLDNQQILRIGLIPELESKGYFNADSLKKSIKSQLGDIEYTDEPIKCLVCGNALYKYSAEEKLYEKAPDTDHGHGGYGTFYKIKYFEKATKNETKGTLDIGYVILYGEHFSDMSYPSRNIYKTPEDSVKDQNGLLEKNEDGYDKDKFDEVYNEKKSELPVTTYSFEKDKEGNYVFKKVSVK